jgi:hypothetical protein
MKKFSADYFEKKFRILFKKLFLKAGFLDAVKQTRKKLGLPVDGQERAAESFIDGVRGGIPKEKLSFDERRGKGESNRGLFESEQG